MMQWYHLAVNLYETQAGFFNDQQFQISELPNPKLFLLRKLKTGIATPAPFHVLFGK
jgi:hypothetical protein